MRIKPKYRSNKYTDKLKAFMNKCEKENNLRIWKRAKSILLYLKKNKEPTEISEFLDVGFKSVYRWLNQYNSEGIEGLYEGEHTGRPPVLTQEQIYRLEDVLDSGPTAYGLITGIWTCPTVKHIIEEEFGISYHHDHVRKILHKLGFSVQRPRKELASAKPELQQKWVKNTYPALKKNARKRKG